MQKEAEKCLNQEKRKEKNGEEKCPLVLTSTEFCPQNSLFWGVSPILPTNHHEKNKRDQSPNDRVTALANATVLSREEFIREALRGTTLQERPPVEYGEFVRELRRIDGNVHELLIKARTLEFVDEIMCKKLQIRSDTWIRCLRDLSVEMHLKAILFGMAFFYLFLLLISNFKS